MVPTAECVAGQGEEAAAVAAVKGVAADAVADYLRSADVYQVNPESHPMKVSCACRLPCQSSRSFQARQRWSLLLLDQLATRQPVNRADADPFLLALLQFDLLEAPPIKQLAEDEATAPLHRLLMLVIDGDVKVTSSAACSAPSFLFFC